jgi:hypothetical protein
VTTVPWNVRKASDGRYCVVKKDGGKVVACHDTPEQARGQLRALYASEPNAGLDSLELNLFIKAAQERDVNLPSGSGHQLREYWTRGPGAAKIRWGTDGSFDRCVRHLGKYVKRPQGLCAEYHKRATGEWPAEKGVPSAGETLEFELHDDLRQLVGDTLEFTVNTDFAAASTDADEANIDAPDAGDLNAAARRVAAERGWALPDGSYPIRDEEHHGLADLDKAIRAVGRGSTSHSKIRRHIMKRARALNASDQIPGNWSATGKREEAALTATQEFHGTHNQKDHGNWADVPKYGDDQTPEEREYEKLRKMKSVSKADVAETVKSLGSGGKPSSSREINPKLDSAEYERGIGERTSNDYDEDDVDEDEKDRRSVAVSAKSTLKEIAMRYLELERKRDSGKLNSAELKEFQRISRYLSSGSGREFALVAAARQEGKCLPGQHKMPDGTCVDDEEMTDDDGDDEMTEYADEPWEGDLVVEGIESGDGRLFALGSLDWVAPPMPLMYQPANTGGHSGSFAVGEITHAVRRGDKIRGRGKIYGAALSGEHGDGIRAVMKVGGVSVDVDTVKDADVEMVYDDAGEGGGKPFAKPEVTIFHRGRIRGATLVAYPAFVEAKLHFTGTLADANADAVEAAAQVVDVPVQVPAKSCGCDGGSGDVVGEFSDDADADRGDTALVVASAFDDSTHTITIPNVPPAHWFSEPTDVEVTGALTITDEGRVYGLVAPAGVTHRNVKTRVPTNLDFSRFHKAETIVRGGGRVVTGVITADCGHAPTENYGTFAKRREHYDNSCSVLANARVGYSRDGNIWVAGALNPGASAEQVAQALGCTLSLDVQPHPDRPGVREFIAAHLVPVPGFPMARSKPSAQYSDGVLSAATLPVNYGEAKPVYVNAELALEFAARAKNVLARALGIDPASRRRELARAFNLEDASAS